MRPDIEQLRTAKQIAAWVNDAAQRALMLRAEVSSYKSSTDRQIGRLRWPGKGRTGARIQIWPTMPPEKRTPDCRTGPLLDHVNSETYRHLGEVRDWLRWWMELSPRKRKLLARTRSHLSRWSA